MSITIARAARRGVVALAATGTLALATPAVAQAATPLVLPPGSTICTKVPAAYNGVHAGGIATNQGATFSVFRNGTLIYLTTPNTTGFDADFFGSGNYKLCATNSNSANTRVTLSLQSL